MAIKCILLGYLCRKRESNTITQEEKSCIIQRCKILGRETLLLTIRERIFVKEEKLSLLLLNANNEEGLNPSTKYEGNEMVNVEHK